jgi:hypothetical protein
MGARFRRQRGSDPAAQSDRQSEFGDAIRADRRPGRKHTLQPGPAGEVACRVFEIGRVFLRAPGAPEGPLDVAGIRQPVRGAGRFSGRPPRSSGALQHANWICST